MHRLQGWVQWPNILAQSSGGGTSGSLVWRLDVLFYSGYIKGIVINWAKVISDNLNFQLRNMVKTKTFNMTSYLVYLLVGFVVYKGLICKGEVENWPGQYKVYECYPQLHMHEIEDYRRMNDAFTTYIARLPQGRIHKWLSKEATQHIEKYGSW